MPLVLGGNVFGMTATATPALPCSTRSTNAGGRMIDTADVYSAWVPGHKGGESETVLGKWFAASGKRGEMRLHTKTGMLGGAELYEPARILTSLDASLERLQTDYVDLYYAHRDYEELAVGDIVSAFNGAVQTGKVRSLGASNFTAERLAKLHSMQQLSKAPCHSACCRTNTTWFPARPMVPSCKNCALGGNPDAAILWSRFRVPDWQVPHRSRSR
jgi:aryl-alcohol dehydrogenase-like predicted oxidoreductase